MKYITSALSYGKYPRNQRALYAALFDNNAPDIILASNTKNFFHTHTMRADPMSYIRTRRNDAIIHLKNCVNSRKDILPISQQEHYHSFRIPKAAGGYREITAPNITLMELQREITEYLTDKIKLLPHNSAYAYTRGRCAKDAMVPHQHNLSRWFLKLDIKDFFPSNTKEYLTKQLKQIYPICNLPEDVMDSMLDICTLNGGLPQGAPSSPILSNIAFLPIDYEISNKLFDYNKTRYVYTRYADDILISSHYDFNHKEITKLIQQILLQHSDFILNKDKARYGSSTGRNWNLGIMYTSDYRLTIGHKRKRRLKSEMINFMKQNATEITWTREQAQVLQGEVGYAAHIEPEDIQQHYDHLARLFGCTFQQRMKSVINQ